MPEPDEKFLPRSDSLVLEPNPNPDDDEPWRMMFYDDIQDAYVEITLPPEQRAQLSTEFAGDLHTDNAT